MKYSVHASCASTDWGRIGYAETAKEAKRMAIRWLREQGRMHEPIGHRGKWSMRDETGRDIAGDIE